MTRSHTAALPSRMHERCSFSFKWVPLDLQISSSLQKASLAFCVHFSASIICSVFWSCSTFFSPSLIRRFVLALTLTSLVFPRLIRKPAYRNSSCQPVHFDCISEKVWAGRQISSAYSLSPRASPSAYVRPLLLYCNVAFITLSVTMISSCFKGLINKPSVHDVTIVVIVRYSLSWLEVTFLII